MQTEEKTEATADQTTGLERHWHLVTRKEGKEVGNVALTGDVEEAVQAVHQTLHIAYEGSRKFLRHAVDASVDPTRVGAAYLRYRALSDLEDVFDGMLFRHPLFQASDAAMDCLEEAVEYALRDLDEVQISEEGTISAYLCEERCEELVKADGESAMAEEGSAMVDHLITEAGDRLKETLVAAGFGEVHISLDVGVGHQVAPAPQDSADQ